MRKYLILLLLLLSAGRLPAQTNVQTLTSKTNMSLQTKNNTSTLFNITLVGNVTSVSIDTGFTGQQANFNICQNGTGGFTWVWPGTFQGTSGITIASGANACTQAQFINVDGTNWQSVGGGGSGSGITSVASLPATCTVGTSVFLTVASTGFPVGQYNCTATNTFKFVGPDLANAINPANFGVTMNALMCRDTNAQFTTTTSVTCLTANFTSADVGKAIFGTCCGLSGGITHANSVLILPQGTITAVNSATNVTVSGAGNAATCAAGGAGCLLIWGTDDSAAWDTTWTAATGTAGHCYPIQMGGGMSLISTAKFLTTVCNTGITGSGSQGAAIVGLGYKASQFVILPNFVAAGCTGVSTSLGSIVCFGPSKGFQLINLGIWGGENGNSTQLNGKVFINFGVDAYAINVLLAGFSAGAGTLTGFNTEASGQTFWTLVVDGFGGGAGGVVECLVSAGTYNVFSEVFCGDNTGIALSITSGAVLTSYGGFYGQTGGTGPDVQQNGTFKSYGDQFFDTGGAGGANIVLGANSLTTISGAIFTNNTNAANSNLFFNSASAKAWVSNSSFTAGGANLDINKGTMGTYFDQGGNTYNDGVAAGTILPTCTFTSGGGTTPSCSLQAGSTNEKGVIIATTGTGAPGSAGTVTLTFAGTFAGASGATPACVYNVDNSGTAWGNEAGTQVSTQSTTAPIVAWFNVNSVVATALTTSSPYRIDYTCVAR